MRATGHASWPSSPGSKAALAPAGPDALREPKPGRVFVAYPSKFDGDAWLYRDHIRHIEGSVNVKFEFLDDDKTAATLTTKARRAVAECEMAVFDLSEANPNVCYELGIAVERWGGLLDNIVLLYNDSTVSDVISDIRGSFQIRYRDYTTMKVQLASALVNRFGTAVPQVPEGHNIPRSPNPGYGAR